MNKPNIQTHVFGNPVSALAIYLIVGVIGFEAVIGNASWVAFIIAAGVAGYAGDCSRKVEEYRLWKMEWDALGGVTRGPGAFARWPWLRTASGAALWVIVMWAAINLNPSHHALFVTLFWAGNLAIIAHLILKASARKKREPAKRASADPKVSICLKMPTVSVDARLTGNAVPEYCRRLLQAGQPKNLAK